jgi:hypothetical protein
MWKATITDGRAENRWILQGQLVGLRVGELRKHWKKKPRTESGPHSLVEVVSRSSI